MSDAKISIIVPVYNVETYLPQCLNSLIGQTYKNLEIICVNDGSTDGSLAILREYAERDGRVKIVSKENKGASVARNTALDTATGAYLMFVDSDDWLEPDTCELALDAMEERNVDLVMWDYIREFSSSSKPKNIFKQDILFDEQAVRSRLHRRMIGIVGEELAHPENADALCTIWGKLYKRSYIEEHHVRFYDIREIGTHEDGLFNLEVLEYVGSACYLHKFLYHYRRNDASSITAAFKPEYQTQRERLYVYMEAYIESHELPEDYRIALRNRMALDLVSFGNNILRDSRGAAYAVKAIKKIVSAPMYHDAYTNLEKKYLPAHWKLFYFFARKRMAWGLYCMMLYIKIRRNSK